MRKYLDRDTPRGNSSSQRWSTFIRNHANAVVACDFFVTVTATFRVLYVFVALEAGSRRILHCNVTEHPTAQWTTQQFREVLAFDHSYRFLVHDRDAIFSPDVDQALKGFGVRLRKTPARAPTANCYCERLVGTIRRECLDYLVLINGRHLKPILNESVRHYNRGRPHSSLEPGIPEPTQAEVLAGPHRHQLAPGYRVTSDTVPSGLHHECRLEKETA